MLPASISQRCYSPPVRHPENTWREPGRLFSNCLRTSDPLSANQPRPCAPRGLKQPTKSLRSLSRSGREIATPAPGVLIFQPSRSLTCVEGADWVEAFLIPGRPTIRPAYQCQTASFQFTPAPAGSRAPLARLCCHRGEGESPRYSGSIEYALLTSSCRSSRPIRLKISRGDTCRPTASRNTLSRLKFVIMEF